MNFSNVKQALELKKKLDQMQKELAKIICEADAGHGAVKVTVNGQQKLLSVKISPEAIDPNKVQKLEEWIVKAVNEAVEKSPFSQTVRVWHDKNKERGSIHAIPPLTR